MSDGKSVCSGCGKELTTPGGSGLCTECIDSQATIAPTPTPNLAGDATIVPGRTDTQVSESRQIGEYDLIEEIARGGMGVVYKARHRRLNRLAAVKMILGGRFSSQEEIQRFRIEAESAAKLDHSAIVPIYEIGEHDGQAFFAMKYIDGGSLAEKVNSFVGRPREAAILMAKVAEGVNHAHQRAVLHRDLKPANILLDSDGHPSVADLGLAKSTSGGSDLTQTGAVLGTPTYMPPEQAAGKTVTTAADVYSLGAILYELLTGRPPYQGDTSVGVVMQVIDGPPPSLKSLNHQVDRDLELIVQKCMHRDPQERYTAAQDMANDLHCWLEDKPISVKPPSMSAVAGKWFRKNEKLVYAAFALFVGILLCAPATFTFFSDDYSRVYDQFGVTDKPLLFKFEAPEWLVAVSVIFLVLVLFPSIGFLNAAISRPRSFWSALRAGLSTSAVLAMIFYCFLGWMIFLGGADNSINQDIEKLTRHVWPTGREGAKPIELNDIYPGLDKIPVKDRAKAVEKRIEADIYASAPWSILAGVGIAFAFAIPIVIGTIVGYILLRRDIPIWLKMLRYLIAWISVCASLIATIGITIAYVDENVEMNGGSPPLPVWIILGGFITVAWLALRKWRKKPRPIAASTA